MGWWCQWSICVNEHMNNEKTAKFGAWQKWWTSLTKERSLYFLIRESISFFLSLSSVLFLYHNHSILSIGWNPGLSSSFLLSISSIVFTFALRRTFRTPICPVLQSCCSNGGNENARNQREAGNLLNWTCQACVENSQLGGKVQWRKQKWGKSTRKISQVNKMRLK